MDEAFNASNKHPERMLRLPAVQALCGLSRSSIYDAISRQEFPAPVKLSRRAVAWPESAIQGWITSRLQSQAGRGAA